MTITIPLNISYETGFWFLLSALTATLCVSIWNWTRLYDATHDRVGDGVFTTTLVSFFACWIIWIIATIEAFHALFHP